MNDDRPSTDEALQEIDSLLKEISVEASPEDEAAQPTNSSTSTTDESPANSTAERILTILLADARLTMTEIADQTGVSEPTARKYINQLEEKNIITGYSVDIDPGERRNRTIASVRVEIDSAASAQVTEALAAMETVRSLFTIQDSTAVIAKIQADDFEELSEIISDDILTITGVEASHITVLEERHT